MSYPVFLTAQAEQELVEELGAEQMSLFDTEDGRMRLNNIFFGNDEGVSIQPFSSEEMVPEHLSKEMVPEHLSKDLPHLPHASASALAPEPLPGYIPIGSFLQHYSLNHASTEILACGLVNKSNWCFMNSILQVSQ